MQRKCNTIAKEQLKYDNSFCFIYLNELVHVVVLRHRVFWKDELRLVGLKQLTVETKRFF